MTTLTWIYGYLKQADMNKDGKMSYKEVQILFKMINIDMNDEYAANLFKVTLYSSAALDLLWNASIGNTLFTEQIQFCKSNTDNNEH